MLPQNQFNNIIRLIRRGDINLVMSLRNVTFTKLKSLKVARDPAKVVIKTPAGSDQVDVQSIVVWVNNVHPSDKDSVAQLVAIDATLVDRS